MSVPAGTAHLGIMAETTTSVTTPDLRDAAVAAVMARHPHLTGEAFDRKVRRVETILRHSSDGPTWTGR
ncbi:hypothetical protein [Nocardioides pakistanensis]